MNNCFYVLQKFLLTITLSVFLLVFFVTTVAEKTLIENVPYTLQDDERISLFRTTYFSPVSYIDSVHSSHSTLPNDQKNKKIETKFQFSFKTILKKKLFSSCNNLYFGYTQVSYWQTYNDSPYFRATNYNPEVFSRALVDYNLPFDWKLRYFDLGYSHQSNGAGGIDERTWDRLFLNLYLTKSKWSIGLNQWVVLKSKLYINRNPRMHDYLGYGYFFVGYQTSHSKLTLASSNKILNNFKRSNFKFTYSLKAVNNYLLLMQIITGYGNSLIEYNHFTTSFVFGIALNDVF